MKLMVICGDSECRTEFSALTEEPRWVCPNCERVIENPHFPFLTARVMQSRFRPDAVDWEELFGNLLGQVRSHFASKARLLEDPAAGAALRDMLEEEGMDLFTDALKDDDALFNSYRERFDGDWRRMHEALLEEARAVAVKVWDLEEKMMPEDGPTGDGGGE